jgi:hypothetical protein
VRNRSAENALEAGGLAYRYSNRRHANPPPHISDANELSLSAAPAEGRDRRMPDLVFGSGPGVSLMKPARVSFIMLGGAATSPVSRLLGFLHTWPLQRHQGCHLALTTPNAFVPMIPFRPHQQGLIKVDGTFA